MAQLYTLAGEPLAWSDLYARIDEIEDEKVQRRQRLAVAMIRIEQGRERVRNRRPKSMRKKWWL